MTNESLQKILRYLESLDKSGKDYPFTPVFLSEINKNLELNFSVNGEIKSYTLSEFLSNFQIKDGNIVSKISSPGYQPPGTTSSEVSEQIFYATTAGALDETTIRPLLGGTNENVVSWDAYTNALKNLFDILGPGLSDASGAQIKLLVGDVEAEENAYSYLEQISSEVTKWAGTDVEGPEGTRAYSASDPKVPNILPTPSTIVGEEGEITFGSKTFYTGPNIAIDANNQFYDPVSGEIKKNSKGEILQPHFKRGSAAAMFEGLSPDAIFEIQRDLVQIGVLDPSKGNFVPGYVNPTSGAEIQAVAMLMMMANDSIVTMPNVNLIDKNATSLYGQLRPFVEFQKRNVEATNIDLGITGIEQFSSEIVPPTEAEVKAVVDELFAQKGITPTSSDYAKYANIFSNLQSQSAAREIEIQKNKPSLSEIIGMSKTTSEINREAGRYVYPGFGVVAPTPEQAREELGMPLLQPIDPKFELSKIIDNIESGRIDASSEIRARSAAANEFKRNFMVFEENF